ncbi:MAG: hypothetical protein ACXACU_13795 [Candidatus Hodarchaeales archaeon]
MKRNVLAEEQLKLELIRVLSKFFMKNIEELVRKRTGAFFPVERIESLELGKRLGRRKELQLMTINVRDSLQNRRFKVDLAFKFLNDIEAAIREGNGAVWLEEVLKNNAKIRTPQLLYFSHENSLLIYEGLRGPQELFDSDLDEPQKLFLAGMALPYIHGVFQRKANLDRYLHLITNVLDRLHFAPEEKDELKSLFKPFLRRIGLNKSGGNSFGDYHPGNVMLLETEENSSNTGDIRIDSTNIYLIDPAYVEREGNVDRAEDLGTFLSKSAFNDFFLTQSFDKTASDFEILCRGYDYTISQNGVSLSDYYPEGPTFNFQIALGILLDSLFKVQFLTHQQSEGRILTSYEAVKYILKKEPFEI